MRNYYILTLLFFISKSKVHIVSMIVLMIINIIKMASSTFCLSKKFLIIVWLLWLLLNEIQRWCSSQTTFYCWLHGIKITKTDMRSVVVTRSSTIFFVRVRDCFLCPRLPLQYRRKVGVDSSVVAKKMDDRK